MNGWINFLKIVRSKPTSTAIAQADQSLTFLALKELAEKISDQLAKAGVKKGHRCVISVENSLKVAALPLAIWKLEACPVFVSDDSPLTHLEYVTDLTKSSCVICSSVAFSSAPFDNCSYEKLYLNDTELYLLKPTHNQLSTNEFDSKVQKRQVGSIVFTSGSTGLPKGVMQSHQTLFDRCLAVTKAMGYREGDALLCPVPWSHDYGWGHLLSLYFIGLQMILPEKKGLISACSTIELYQPTIIAGVPSFFASLIRGVSPIRNIDTTFIRLLISTGSVFQETILKETLAIFKNADISLNYGLTETYRTTSFKLSSSPDKHKSVGKPIDGVNLKILRNDGTLAKPGELGEIIHCGEGCFLGYWQNEIKTQKALTTDSGREVPNPIKMVYTGDLGWMDNEGFLYIKGRKDRQIKSMGVRVSPDEIEGILLRGGIVSQIAITALPHEILGEMVVAVISSDNASRDCLKQLKRIAHKEMSPNMRPREYYELDKIPLTNSGKINYPKLQQVLIKLQPIR